MLLYKHNEDDGPS